MATQKQMQANRTNARKSTGPRTAEGKARSSLNALTHGLTAKTILLPNENPEDLARLWDAVIDYFAPTHPFELQLLEPIVGCHWRLLRAQRLEAELLLAGSYDDITDTYDASEMFRSEIDERRLGKVAIVDITADQASTAQQVGGGAVNHDGCDYAEQISFCAAHSGDEIVKMADSEIDRGAALLSKRSPIIQRLLLIARYHRATLNDLAAATRYYFKVREQRADAYQAERP